MPASEVLEAPCPECGGRGWVVVADGGAGTARPCVCQRRDVVPRLIQAAGIPPRYRRCRLSNFHVSSGRSRQEPQLLAARKAAQDYVDEFLQEGVGFRQSGLLFVGPEGVGKTHLAVAVLLELIERFQLRGRFVEFTSLIHQLQSTFDSDSQESKRQLLDPLSEIPLLVLDELGAQQPTPWVKDILYLIINARYTRRLPTLFTTNYRLDSDAAPKKAPVRVAGRTTMVSNKDSLDRGPDAVPPQEEPALLSKRLPPMLVSRLYEMAQPVVLDTVADFRLEYKDKVDGARLR
jgi:DNA replication protein DnaC